MMTGSVPLFEKDAHGLLHQVSPEMADEARQGRRCSQVCLAIDVLWTQQEEAARNAEEAEAARLAAEQAAAQAQLADVKANKVRQVETKLSKLGLTVEDLRNLMG